MLCAFAVRRLSALDCARETRTVALTEDTCALFPQHVQEATPTVSSDREADSIPRIDAPTQLPFIVRQLIENEDQMR